MDAFTPYTKDTVSGGGADDITRDGKYIFQVIDAYDTYKVNPEDVDDPDRSRRISLRLKAIKAVRDTEGDIVESDEDFAERQDQAGNVRRVSLWLDREGHGGALEGRLKILATIAGMPAKPDEDLLDRALKGTKNGQPEYDLGLIADEAHINCAQLVGRSFEGKIENTDQEYPGLFPWYAIGVDEEDQPDFKGEPAPEPGSLYTGEDTASKAAKERFEQLSNDEPEYEPAGDGAALEPDDELPF